MSEKFINYISKSHFHAFEVVVDAVMESCSSGTRKIAILKVVVIFHYRSAQNDWPRIELFYRNIPCKLIHIYTSINADWY